MVRTLWQIEMAIRWGLARDPLRIKYNEADGESPFLS